MATLRRGPVLDARSNATPSEQRIRALGLPSLRENNPLAAGPAVLLQVSHSHRERIIARVRQHTAAAPAFEEICQHGDNGILLYRCGTQDSTTALLQSIFRDEPLCSALPRQPFVASSCTESVDELTTTFVAACTNAHASGNTVKLSGALAIRSALLDAALGTTSASCLVASGETMTFHVASAYRGGAYFYHTSATPTWRPSDEAVKVVNYCPSLCPPGHWHTPADTKDAAGVCKAFYKLRELIAEEPPLLASLAHAAATGGGVMAIDIGASPGGWTELLAHFGEVVAIDPGALLTRVTARPNVTHLRCRLADDGASIPKLRAAMRSSAHAATHVVCDANIPAAEAGALIALLASSSLLAVGCHVVVTLKAAQKVRASRGVSTRQEQRAQAVEALGEGFAEVRVRQLFANTQHEATLSSVFTGGAQVLAASALALPPPSQPPAPAIHDVDVKTVLAHASDGEAVDVSAAVCPEAVDELSDGAQRLLRELRRLDGDASLTRRIGTQRYCTNVSCLCDRVVRLHKHTIAVGHVALDGDRALDAAAICERIVNTPCSCCKAMRAAARRAALAPPKTCYTCQQPGHLVRDCPQSTCKFCGRTGHLARECTLGQGTSRSQQFLSCGPRCFPRRFIVPLHRARTDFDPDDLLSGRVDVACRLITATLIASQRVRHNAQLWLPFLGNTEHPITVCVSGGPVRGLHPSESDTVWRLRQAFDSLPLEPPPAGTPTQASSLPAEVEHELRGFGLLGGGLHTALTEALHLARADGVAAPVLLLLEGAPPLAQVLDAHCRGGGGAELEDVVVVLGDDRGLSDEEVAMVKDLGERQGGGGPVLCASLGATSLLASHAIVLTHHYLDAIHACPSRLWQGPAEEVQQMARQIKRRNARRARRKQANVKMESASRAE